MAGEYLGGESEECVLSGYGFISRRFAWVSVLIPRGLICVHDEGG